MCAATSSSKSVWMLVLSSVLATHAQAHNDLTESEEHTLSVYRNVTDHNAAYVAACVLVRDEDPDTIMEWLTYHERVGIRKFYFYDHVSKVPITTFLRNHIINGLVEVHTLNYAPTAPDEFNIGHMYANDYQGIRLQLYVYNLCVRSYRHRHRWMAIFDVDEYIEVLDVPDDVKHAMDSPGAHEHLPLPYFMREFEEDGSLRIHWHVFGSCGFITPPRTGIAKSYTCCTPRDHRMNFFQKNILNTEFLGNHCRVHECHTTRTSVNERHEDMEGKDAPYVAHDRIKLRHYYYRSLEEFESKQARGWPNPQDKANKGDVLNDKYSLTSFRELDKAASEHCPPL